MLLIKSFFNKGTIVYLYLQHLEEALIQNDKVGRMEELRVKGLVQGPSGGSLVDLRVELTTFTSVVQHLNH